MINEPDYSDKLIEAILAHKGIPTKFDPAQVQVFKLKSLHGQELSKRLESENPTEQEMETALRNAIGRIYPQDANELVDQMKKEAGWKKGAMVFEVGGLAKWIDGLNCPPVRVVPPTQYDLSLLDSINQDTQASGSHKEEDDNESGSEEEDEEEAQTIPDVELTKAFTELQPMADMKLDEADFPFKTSVETRDLLLCSLPAYILSVAPKYLHAARKLQDLTTDMLIKLLQPIEFVKFLNKYGIEKKAPPVTESKFKYGKDDHGSKEVTTYKIQIRSSIRTGEVTGNVYDKYRPLVAFVKAMLDTLNHECQFIQFDSRPTALH
jgi:hypothetical protein